MSSRTRRQRKARKERESQSLDVAPHSLSPAPPGPVPRRLDATSVSLRMLNSLTTFLPLMSPEDIPGFLATSIGASEHVAAMCNIWLHLRKRPDIPPNGVGRRVNLVNITDEVWPQPVTYKNRLSVVHEHPAMKAVPGHVKAGSVERGRSGMICENTECEEIVPDKRPDFHYPTKPPNSASSVLKRCHGCLQVSYCSKECQTHDWARHKTFCKTFSTLINREELPRDGFSRMVKSLLANPCLGVLLKSYARDLHDLDHYPARGMRDNIVFTCTTVEENVGDLPEGHQRRLIFQISRVEVVPYDANAMQATRTLHLDKEIERCLFELQHQSIIDEQLKKDVRITKHKKGTPQEMEGAYKRMKTFDIGVMMTFKSDIDGASSMIFSVERVMRAMMVSMIKMPEPILWLLQFNQTIREDLENKFGLRVKAPMLSSPSTSTLDSKLSPGTSDLECD